MDKYAEYLDDADDASGESTKMMREAMAHTQVRARGLRARMARLLEDC